MLIDVKLASEVIPGRVYLFFNHLKKIKDKERELIFD